MTRDEEEQLYERFYLLEEALDLVEHLWRTFVTLRLDDDAWRTELESIRAWVRGE